MSDLRECSMPGCSTIVLGGGCCIEHDRATHYCPNCGLVVRLRKNGSVRTHKRFRPWGKYSNGMPAFARCEGSGKLPTSVR